MCGSCCVTGVLSSGVCSSISVVHSVSRVSVVINVTSLVEMKSSAYFMEVVGVAGSFVPFDSVFSEMKSTGFDGFSSYMVAVVVTGVLSPVVDKLISVVHSVSRVSLLVMSPVWLK